MIREKKQGAEDANSHRSHDNVGASWIAFVMFFFFCICLMKKTLKKNNTLKHAVVNNKMESGIVTLFKVGFNITNSWSHRP